MYIYTYYTPYKKYLQAILKKQQNINNIFTYMVKIFLNINSSVAQNMSVIIKAP